MHDNFKKCLHYAMKDSNTCFSPTNLVQLIASIILSTVNGQLQNFTGFFFSTFNIQVRDTSGFFFSNVITQFLEWIQKQFNFMLIIKVVSQGWRVLDLCYFFQRVCLNFCRLICVISKFDNLPIYYFMRDFCFINNEVIYY